LRISSIQTACLPLRRQGLRTWGLDSSITSAEVAEAVEKLPGGKAPGGDEIHPELLKALDTVGLL